MTIDGSARLAHFEALYADSDDPWNVRGAWYEQRKRALLLACLRKPRYRSVFEPGCGNGELSAALARRCGQLLACDGAAGAVTAAARRLADVRKADCDVRIEHRRLPEEWPAGARFDLVVVSELAYYFDAASIGRMLDAAQRALDDDGELLMCHYLPGFDDRVTATRAVHRIADDMPGLVRTLRHEDGDFLLESWRPARPGRHGGAAP